jgi:hypothetical protein
MLLPDEHFLTLFDGEPNRVAQANSAFCTLMNQAYFAFALKVSATRPDIAGRVRVAIDAKHGALDGAGEIRALEAELQSADSDWAVPLLIEAVTEAQTGLRPSFPWA